MTPNHTHTCIHLNTQTHEHTYSCDDFNGQIMLHTQKFFMRRKVITRISDLIIGQTLLRMCYFMQMLATYRKIPFGPSLHCREFNTILKAGVVSQYEVEFPVVLHFINFLVWHHNGIPAIVPFSLAIHYSQSFLWKAPFVTCSVYHCRIYGLQ